MLFFTKSGFLFCLIAVCLFSAGSHAWPRVASYYATGNSNACTSASPIGRCNRTIIDGSFAYHYSLFSGTDFGSDPSGSGVSYSSLDLDLCATAVREEASSLRVVSRCTEYVYIARACDEHESVGENGECIDKNVPDTCEGGQPSPLVGNPINSLVGSKYQVEQDFIGGGVFPLSVKRSFSGSNLSQNWAFSYQKQLIVFNDASRVIVKAIRGNGYSELFSGNVTAGWSSDPDVTTKLEAITENDKITGWHLRTSNDNLETYNSSGLLMSVSNRAGLSHTYTYTDTSIIVSHDNGQKLIYQLGEQNIIVGFLTPTNEQISYNYDVRGLLSEVIYPRNTGSREYHYESVNFPNLLTGITDENKKLYVTWEYDEQGRAISSERNDGVYRTTLDYSQINNATDPRVTITNALNKKTTFHYRTINGVRKIFLIEGHPSVNCAGANKHYTYDTNGFIASKTDWKNVVTTYTHNDRGQEVSRTEAFGTPQAKTIQTEWHSEFNLPTRIVEPERYTEYSYDSQGRLINKNITILP